MKCPMCGNTGIETVEKILKGKIHHREQCAGCGRFIRFIQNRTSMRNYNERVHSLIRRLSKITTDMATPERLSALILEAKQLTQEIEAVKEKK